MKQTFEVEHHYSSPITPDEVRTGMHCNSITVRELPESRVRRIEWGPDDDVEIIGWMNSHNFNISWWTNHERGWHFSLGVLDKRGGPFETKDTAKAACQSAFDAWVKSMMEV